MTLKAHTTCRKYSLLIIFMLLLQHSFSQYNFTKADDWLKTNLTELGGRAVLVIYKDGKIIYNNAQNNLTQRQKIVTKLIAKRQGKDAEEMLQDFTSKSKERIASSSKWLSAAVVMTFVAEGKLNLNDTIGKYLPVMTANGKGSITIWQCLSHLTAIQSAKLKESLAEIKDAANMDDAIATIAQKPMEGKPGKTFHYSGIGLQIAAAVIEKISGKNFETLFTERIAKPCNMINSDFGHATVALAAGGAWCTSEDYLNFLQMILNNGMFNGKQILSKNAITEMQKNKITADVTIAYSPAEAGHWGYGFGEWIMQDAKINTQANAISSPGLFGSFPWIDTKNKYAAFLMVFNLNSNGRHDRYVELKKIVDEVFEK